jgi:cysteine synthase A
VTPQDIHNMVERAGELAAQPGHFATDQFNNPYPVPHYREHLGREIWEQTRGRVTAFCHGLGTAGSVMGVSDALKSRGVFIQAHEPASSAAISGGAPGSFAIQGWAGFAMPLWDASKVDQVEAIEDDEALAMTLRLAQEEGIFAGISTSGRTASPSASARARSSSRSPSTAASST